MKNVQTAETGERFGTLINNAAAVRAVVAAVEGTLGPMGLDCMLVDHFGEVTITNDGVTILDKMDAAHPAARMVIQVARAQQQQVGDGTTTAAVMAGTLINEGVDQVLRGVPVIRIIEGIRIATARAVAELESMALPVRGLQDPLLRAAALVAARNRADIADVICQAAVLIGEERLRTPAFRLSETVLANEGAANEAFTGVVVERQRLSRDMPGNVENARLLLLHDTLDTETVEEETLTTEAGFNRYMEEKRAFVAALRTAVELGVNVIMTDRGISDLAEEILTDAGVLAVQRVALHELRRVAEHTGARLLKRSGLKRASGELERCLGQARRVREDERLRHIRVESGAGIPAATVLIGAATSEVVGERERIARDAGDALQWSLRGGVVTGGGAAELAVVSRLASTRSDLNGMAGYGLDCVMAALKRPFTQIVANAGFNPLEKLEQILVAQSGPGGDGWGLDCDSGEACDLKALGILDPAPVKIHAVKAAGELAEAVLRINTVIRQRHAENMPE